MANKKISEFPALEAGNLTDADVLPIVNDLINKKISWASIKEALASSDIVDWGDIGGTLTDQTDLQNALNTKLDESKFIGLSYAISNRNLMI